MATDALYIQNKRLKRDLYDIHNNKDTYYQLVQDDSNKLKFYFLFCGAEKTSFEGGYYIGYIQLSDDYPFGSPNYYMLTISDRMEVNKTICFTNTSYYKDSLESTASAALSVSALFLQFYSSFNDENDLTGHSGHLHYKSKDSRILLAKNSIKYNIDNYREILLKFDKFIKSRDKEITLRTIREVEEYLKNN